MASLASAASLSAAVFASGSDRLLLLLWLLLLHIILHLLLLPLLLLLLLLLLRVLLCAALSCLLERPAHTCTNR